MKKQEFKRNKTKQNKTKNEENITRLWDISKTANIQIIRIPEGEEEEKEIGNLFQKIMKETANVGEDMGKREH